MSVFEACFEHALVNRPPANECFSGVPGHGEGHASSVNDLIIGDSVGIWDKKDGS